MTILFFWTAPNNTAILFMQRLIGQYSGLEHGTLIIALAAMHGNEPAGVRALRNLFDMLDNEPTKNPHFQFRGRLVGFIGNIQALERKMRFVKKDLNRQLTKEHIERLKAFHLVELGEISTPSNELLFEDLELKELMQYIENEIITYKPSKLILLDLHTTSASGGIFTIVSEQEESLKIASELYAPVVKGFVQGVGGSTLHYFNQDNTGVPTVALAFEAGQHDDPFSVRRTIAWLVNCLRSVGCVDGRDIEHRHDEILRGYSKGLPKVVQLIGIHKVTKGDGFKMVEGYQNFQVVKKSEILAYDNRGAITAPENCLILMPLYQQQGSDGFFLVKEI
jgi:succinylglutamate desuccinylase